MIDIAALVAHIHLKYEIVQRSHSLLRLMYNSELLPKRSIVRLVEPQLRSWWRIRFSICLIP
jgi:hypothetical protein